MISDRKNRFDKPVLPAELGEAKLILAVLDAGVNLIEITVRNGALADAWTLDAHCPNLRDELRSEGHYESDGIGSRVTPGDCSPSVSFRGTSAARRRR